MLPLIQTFSIIGNNLKFTLLRVQMIKIVNKLLKVVNNTKFQHYQYKDKTLKHA